MPARILVFLIAMLLMISCTLSAQAPQEINYQAVVRNAQGQTVAGNTPVIFRFTIHSGSPAGTAVYTETSPTLVSNAFGLVTYAIGSGADLRTVAWGSGTKWLQTEVNVNNGGYTDMGTTQLLSVPYALYAGIADSVRGGTHGATGAAGVTGATGATGPPGAAGTNGTNGIDGATGPTGAAGTSGTNGITGATGSTGATGLAGTNGTNGVTGPTGSAGANGTNGIDGVTGPTGAAGTNGTNGATGPTGSAGTNGTNGVDGATGPTGAAGTNGTNGITGATGATGSTGATGLAGNNGTNGVDGVTGPTGAAGINGTNGADGATGLAGTNGTNGATGPTGSAGVNGTNGIDGATGPTGAAGTNGTNGATGPTGSAGTNGINGIDGATGPTGAAGTNGTNGATGATGAAGTNGTNGVDGATGPTGAAGTTGTNGATGATGAAGINGTNGATGATGAAGIDGTNGVTGATGATGAKGNTGDQGATGPAGSALFYNPDSINAYIDTAGPSKLSKWLTDRTGGDTIWRRVDSAVYLSNPRHNVGIGTHTPTATLEVSGSTILGNDVGSINVEGVITTFMPRWLKDTFIANGQLYDSRYGVYIRDTATGYMTTLSMSPSRFSEDVNFPNDAYVGLDGATGVDSVTGVVYANHELLYQRTDGLRFQDGVFVGDINNPTSGNTEISIYNPEVGMDIFHLQGLCEHTSPHLKLAFYDTVTSSLAEMDIHNINNNVRLVNWHSDTLSIFDSYQATNDDLIVRGGFNIPANGGDGKVLMSDASGQGSWQYASYDTLVTFAGDGVRDSFGISYPLAGTVTAGGEAGNAAASAPHWVTIDAALHRAFLHFVSPPAAGSAVVYTFYIRRKS